MLLILVGKNHTSGGSTGALQSLLLSPDTVLRQRILLLAGTPQWSTALAKYSGEGKISASSGCTSKSTALAEYSEDRNISLSSGCMSGSTAPAKPGRQTVMGFLCDDLTGHMQYLGRQSRKANVL